MPDEREYITQPDLFPDDVPEYFDGETYDPERDADRLAAQTQRVYAVMRDRAWHTLADLAERAHAPEASVSARLRDLRKPRFGQHIIDRRYVTRGLFEYRLADAP